MKIRYKSRRKLPKTIFWWYFPISILFLEIVLRLTTVENFVDFGLFFILLFTSVIGIVLSVLSTFSKPKINRRIAIGLMAAATLIYIVQLVYTEVFGTYLILYSVNVGGQVLQFWDTMVKAIITRLPVILISFIPLVLFILLGKKRIVFYKTTMPQKLLMVVFAAALQILATVIILLSDSGAVSLRLLYKESFIPDASVAKFGLLTTERLDIKYMMFGGSDDLDDLGNVSNPGYEQIGDDTSSDDTQYTEQKIYKDQVMNIDFDSLIAKTKDEELITMHNYFSKQQPTKTNDYTGMFKDKNLIFITAEGFSPYVIDKNLTPTLYKMQEEGFKFNNFYTPIWGVSTSDGEYVACTGLIPKPGVWSFSRSGNNYMPFCMGNQFKKLGANPFAYHNNTHTYYDRHKSHPNMGYTYKGLGSGLDVKQTWPESDLEMIEKTTDDYINDDLFHSYYMTVSGHLQYTFSGNYIAYKNRDLVANVDYSEHVKAYLACNIELDKAMEELLKRLNDAGVADDTVIVISPDHYPYGLTNEEIGELAGHEIEKNFELYKGVLLIYSQGMEKPVVVDKPASSLDIIPTISNLLGLEYDSRLLMGTDIMSNSPPLVIFSNRSWITDKGKLNSKTGKFEPFEGVTVDGDYRKYITSIVSNKFKISQKMLERDYYGVVFGKK